MKIFDPIRPGSDFSDPRPPLVGTKSLREETLTSRPCKALRPWRRSSRPSPWPPRRGCGPEKTGFLTDCYFSSDVGEAECFSNLVEVPHEDAALQQGGVADLERRKQDDIFRTKSSPTPGIWDIPMQCRYSPGLTKLGLTERMGT